MTHPLTLFALTIASLAVFWYCAAVTSGSPTIATIATGIAIAIAPTANRLNQQRHDN